MSTSVRLHRGLLIGLSLLLCAAGACDALTPSSPPERDESSSAPAMTAQPIDYGQAAAKLSYTFPVELGAFAQVVRNSYNWQGPADASLKGEIGFTGDAMVVRGQMCDDHPLFQTAVHPAKPDWWEIGYGADGVELILEDPTSSTQRIQIALNFSAHGVNPRVDVLASPFRARPGFAGTAVLQLSGGDAGCAGNQRAMRFEAAIPYAELAPARFFEKPIRITVRLHDMDGDPSAYLMMQDAIEARPPGREP